MGTASSSPMPCRCASGCSSSRRPSPASASGSWPRSSAMPSTWNGRPSPYGVPWPRHARTASWSRRRVRTVAFPTSLPESLTAHLDSYAEPGRTGLVFTGARGGQLRRNNFRRLWLRALETTGLGDVHFHDLRHTGTPSPRTSTSRSGRPVQQSPATHLARRLSPASAAEERTRPRFPVQYR
ncbi:tyrosine-type recombinase/integrase [Streptomyces sp. NPDC018000]|uniref:tyrosine-type recombinase/integrase n=1 Tax=Streptomyces sp. NPDC018000 TaxID=3365028 RepID=UPI0037935828